MNQTYAYPRYDRTIKFRMVSAQHFINEAPGGYGDLGIRNKQTNISVDVNLLTM